MDQQSQYLEEKRSLHSETKTPGEARARINAQLLRMSLARMNQSASWLARQLGVTRVAVHWWMVGTNRPTVSTINKIENLVGVHPGFLVAKESEVGYE